MALDIKPIIYAEEYHEDKPSIFREGENLDRLLQAIFDVCYQQQLDFLWLSQNLLNVDVAEKSHLDFIGNIVGQPRFLSDFNTEPYFGYEGSYQSKTFGSSLDPEVGGYWNSRSYFNTATSRQLNDDEYRRLIKARAIYNQSNCTANDLLEVINLLSNSKNNTVQMLSHGLIKINTDDSSGIISYFVDRLFNDDNILPVAAGVRVIMESLPTGEGGDGGVLPDTDWEVKKVYEGSTGSKVGIDAVRTKNNLEVESSIEVVPTVGQISDRIKTGEYGAEVNKAVLDIDSNAVDWVLDLDSDAVKYKDPNAPSPDAGTAGTYYIYNSSSHPLTGVKYPSFNAAINAACAFVGSTFDGNWYLHPNAGYDFATAYCKNGNYVPLAKVRDPAYVPPDVGDDYKYIPIDTVAAKVIANAEAGHAESKSLLVSVVSVLASMKFYDPLF